jgi:transketolase
VRARVAVEAGVPTGWREFVGDAGEVIGIDHFGASADAATLFEKFGFTASAVVSAARRSLKNARSSAVPSPTADSARTDKPATKKPARKAAAKG